MHPRTFAGRADSGLHHAIDPRQRLLDQSGTGRAVHAGDAQRRIGQRLADRRGAVTGKAPQLDRIVEHGQTGRRAGGGHGVRHGLDRRGSEGQRHVEIERPSAHWGWR